MANKGHLSDTLKRETVAQDSFPTDLVEPPVENAYVVVGTTLPTPSYESEEWKTNFPHFFPGCVPPTVPPNGSFLSQICEDMDPQKWSSVGFEEVLASPRSTAVKGNKRSRGSEEQSGQETDEIRMKREAEKEKNRERMRRLRSLRDNEKIAKDREKARERTRRVRASWDEARRQQERERAREYMRKRRAMKAHENKQRAISKDAQDLAKNNNNSSMS